MNAALIMTIVVMVATLNGNPVENRNSFVMQEFPTAADCSKELENWKHNRPNYFVMTREVEIWYNFSCVSR